MKHLVESLEEACSQSDEHRETFLKLKREIEATRKTLKTSSLVTRRQPPYRIQFVQTDRHGAIDSLCKDNPAAGWNSDTETAQTR